MTQFNIDLNGQSGGYTPLLNDNGEHVNLLGCIGNATRKFDNTTTELIINVPSFSHKDSQGNTVECIRLLLSPEQHQQYEKMLKPLYMKGKIHPGLSSKYAIYLQGMSYTEKQGEKILFTNFKADNIYVGKHKGESEIDIALSEEISKRKWNWKANGAKMEFTTK